jgi:hypothetical protein
VGTDAPADCWQVALGSDDADGIAQVAFLQFVDPVGYVVFDRAAFLALRHLAMQASLSLLDGLSHSVTLVDFFFESHNLLLVFKLLAAKLTKKMQKSPFSPDILSANYPNSFLFFVHFQFLLLPLPALCRD